ncbi:endonuclease domain-containing protein [Hymenobacter sp. IS2118]|uniref:endonuclease domain-containing protein n=1 Tax=Hymenobacter sp. IS2118 TaxID=1505605 RepID=UPI001F394388|nr:endonuclease domain-containing protein [Hymenobacter sp. IS2118]
MVLLYCEEGMDSSEERKKSRQAPLPPEGKGSGDGVHMFGMYTTDAKRWKTSLKAYARTNRKTPTPAEHKLWQELRGSKLGAPFRRQHAIESFIVDFVCLAAWLVIEVDGSIHAEIAQAEYDGGRTYELEKIGYSIVRFTNEEVLHETANVLKKIAEHLTALYPNYEPR